MTFGQKYITNEGYEKNGCMMSRGDAIQRAAIALAAVAVMAVAVIAYFSYTNPGSPGNIIGSSRSSSQSTCTLPPGQVGNATVTITETAGQFPSCGCALADSNSNGTLYVSTNVIVGDNVCITASLEHSAEVYLGVTNATGSLVFSGNCVALPPPGAPPPTGDTCTAYWDTAKPDPQGNPIEPGSYRLIASDGEGSQAVLEANISLASSGAVATAYTTDGNGTVSASRTWGLWSFEVSMNSTSVRVGGAINLDERLTYHGNANTTMEMVNPVSSASVYNSTGAQVWAWTPGGVTWRVTVYPGETFGDPICIPTAMLNATEENLTHCFFNFREEPVPGVYSVVAAPILLPSGGQDLGQNLQISLNFTITS